MKQLNLLISAYSCEPNRGSEPGVGWSVAHSLAQYHRVWVLTWAGHKPAIEQELAKHPQPNLEVVYYRLPKILDWMWDAGFPNNFHYYLWQIGAARIALRLCERVRFDLAQHVTYVRYWQPSLLAFLPVPFIWGPVGGGESAPAGFRRMFSREGKIKDALRNVVRSLGELDPLVRLTVRRSSLCIATTPETAARLRAVGCEQVELLTAIALGKDELATLPKLARPPRAEVRFISMGRLLHWKGFSLGIEAFARARIPYAEFWIIGDGPERPRMEQRILELGLERRVRFFGWLSREESLKRLGEADVLVHPSFHESGGGVCLEAMAAGKPVICLDLGGPGQQVTPDTGCKIAASTPDDVIADLAAAMEQLAANPQLRQSMGCAGRARVNDKYTWEKKIQVHLDQYARVLAASPHPKTRSEEPALEVVP